MQLHVMSQRLRADLLPESKSSRGSPVDAASSGTTEPSDARLPMSSGFGQTIGKAAPIQTSMNIDPAQLKFEVPPKFNAEKFLVGPLLRAGLRDPRAFRKPRSEWVQPRLAKVQASRASQLELYYRKWASVHQLYLVPASESEYRYRCGLFAVYKNEQTERQILNPIPENSRSFSVFESTRTLAHSSLLCQLFIPRDQALVINSDEISDFYHNFRVSSQHAARNHVHRVFEGRIFEGWNAYRPELHGQEVVGCFRTLAMGTNFAVELAQQSHSVLLYRAGCLREHEVVRYRHPLPSGPGFDLLCIDD